jgi:hypothetical protein
MVPPQAGLGISHSSPNPTASRAFGFGQVRQEAYDVLLLTPRDASRTIRLQAPITNDTVTASGKPWGWTLSQRYTDLDKLTSGAAYTSQL